MNSWGVGGGAAGVRGRLAEGDASKEIYHY
jgi:hypothetical protein